MLGLTGSAGLAGGLVGWALAWLQLRGPSTGIQRSAESDTSAQAAGARAQASCAELVADAGVADVLGILASSGIVVDQSDAVVIASPSALALGLVRDADIAHPQLRDAARAVRRDRVVRERDLQLPRGPLGEGVLSVHARIAPLGADHVLLLVEDRTQAQRVEEVRRDFVANVSHELKTPVGGIALLVEAISAARDDPEAVERFANQIGVESARLSTLVEEIVELSRLQADDALAEPVLLDVSDVVAESIEATHTLAEAKRIVFVTELTQGSFAYGDARMLRTAVVNLLTNAVNYSPGDTRVAVTARTRGAVVEITVADQGPGIPAAVQGRIFERFYRVDPARSRATGGTGLGLAIVKHICTSHGGEVTVWSSEGHGSTFTIRLPAAPEPSALAARPFDQPEQPADVTARRRRGVAP